MNIQVKYFAAFREAVGIDTESFVTDVGSPAELFEECVERHAGLQKYSATLVAINDEMASWDTVLHDNDVVLFFPPVAGG